MKTAILSAPLTAALLLVACATVDAETPTAEGSAEAPAADKPAPPPMQRASAGHGKRSFVETYDTDGDGQVTLVEFMTEREVGYGQRDADGDGTVHEEEYVSEYEVRLEQELKAQHDRQIKQAYVRFNVLDQDKDGTISLAEFNASGSRMFSKLDTNGDGIVNEEDTAKAY